MGCYFPKIHYSIYSTPCTIFDDPCQEHGGGKKYEDTNIKGFWLELYSVLGYLICCIYSIKNTDITLSICIVLLFHFRLLSFSYRNMTERERSDFLSGDKNNDHFYKRSHSNSSGESVPTKKTKLENVPKSGSFPKLSNKTGKLWILIAGSIHTQPRACIMVILSTTYSTIKPHCRGIVMQYIVLCQHKAVVNYMHNHTGTQSLSIFVHCKAVVN